MATENKLRKFLIGDSNLVILSEFLLDTEQLSSYLKVEDAPIEAIESIIAFYDKRASFIEDSLNTNLEQVASLCLRLKSIRKTLNGIDKLPEPTLVNSSLFPEKASAGFYEDCEQEEAFLCVYAQGTSDEDKIGPLLYRIPAALVTEDIINQLQGRNEFKDFVRERSGYYRSLCNSPTLVSQHGLLLDQLRDLVLEKETMPSPEESKVYWSSLKVFEEFKSGIHESIGT